MCLASWLGFIVDRVTPNYSAPMIMCMLLKKKTCAKFAAQVVRERLVWYHCGNSYKLKRHLAWQSDSTKIWPPIKIESANRVRWTVLGNWSAQSVDLTSRHGWWCWGRRSDSCKQHWSFCLDASVFSLAWKHIGGRLIGFQSRRRLEGTPHRTVYLTWYRLVKVFCEKARHWWRSGRWRHRCI